MEMIEHNIELVIHGKSVEDSDDFCDYSIDDQNEAAGMNFFTTVGHACVILSFLTRLQ